MAGKNKNMFLYWGSGSGPCMKVMFVLAEKGMLKDCPQKLIEFSKKEHKTEEVLKLNPRGQMPTFNDGDVVVNESSAICMYLEEKYGGEGTCLLPKDAGKRAAVYQRMLELSNMDSAIRPVFMYVMKTKEEDRDKAHVKELIEKAEEEIARWNTYLTGKTYLCNEEFSMADIFLFVMTATLVRQGGVLDKKYPALKAFHDTIGKRPAAVESLPPHWKDSPSPNVLKGLGQ